MNYAMIRNGVIDNIIVADYTSAQLIAQMAGYEAAINCDRYPIGIGDLYENGEFMTSVDKTDENGNILVPARTVINRNISDEEIIELLKAKNSRLEAELVEANQRAADNTQNFNDFVGFFFEVNPDLV